MNIDIVRAQLAKDYPGKKIIAISNQNNKQTELVCEINESESIAVIDSTQPHYHKKTKETYEVLRGDLSVFKNDTEFRMHAGDTLSIETGAAHYAVGGETWVKITAVPLRDASDYYIVS